MHWFQLCLIVVAVSLTPYLSVAEEEHKLNLKDELLPTEPIIEHNEQPIVKKKLVKKPLGKHLKPSLIPNLSRSIGPNTGFQFPAGLIQAPLVGQPFDAQASSASNNVLLVLNNDKHKFGDLSNPAGELKRLTRNPDVVEDIVGQFQSLGGGVAQQLLQQVTQTAPDMSRSFGQALNEALQHTTTLAQTSPGNINLGQLAQTLSQSPLSGNIDFGQLGQSLSQSFIVGAAQNLLNPNAGQAGAEAAGAGADAGAAEGEADAVVGAAAEEAEAEPEAEPEAAAAEAEEPAAPEAPKNPFEQIVGSALLPPLGLNMPPALQTLPLGMLGSLGSLGLNPFMALGSEISEVRVMPDQYNPYKIAPKQVDHQTMAEMKLKAILKDALDKKTIPILWFHLPSNHNFHKTTEDLEMEAKLKIFENQVINELKQLQELAKLANEVKRAQLESGSQPTATLTTKLNLYEIPIYDITLGDIEKTLKDEHVIMLMHTIVQKQQKHFHRHHQATTKYLTDLTGAPIKRQTKTAEDALKTMEKDDMLKMMTYAYRMAAAHGHEMPWIKNEKIKEFDDKGANKNTMDSQQRQAAEGAGHMKDERQWLEDKQRQMAMEAEKQKQMAEERKPKANPNQVRQWTDPHMTQQPIERQWANQPQQRQMLPPQFQPQQQPMPMFDPNMQHQQEMQRQMQQQMFNMQPQMHMERQWLQPTNMQQQQPITTNPMMQRQWADPNMPPQLLQRQWAEMPENKATMKSEAKPEQRQSADSKMPEQPAQFKTDKPAEQRQWADPAGTSKPNEQLPEHRQWADPAGTSKPNEQLPEHRQWADPAGTTNSNEQLPEQRQWFDGKIPDQTAAKANDNTMAQRQWADANNKPKTAGERTDSMTLVGEAKPQMAENAGQARHKGMEDMFDELDVFDHARHKEKEAAAVKPTIINYYYNAGRLPPVYAPPPPAPAAAPYAYGGGYVRPAAPPPPPAPAPASYPAVAPQYKPPTPVAAGYYGGVAHASNAYGSYGGYRTATGDEEIAAMLRQHQTMPKIMLRIPDIEEPNQHAVNPITTTTTTITNPIRINSENDINNAEDVNQIPAKRLEPNQTEFKVTEPAAYIIVIRNNTSKTNVGKSRRKRSAEYATLEPIDESSLDALRKTYKNSLKEITLNPNETPAEALMRYNAESIREALQKANQQPMEISAGGEGEEAKDSGNIATEVEQQQQQHQNHHHQHEEVQEPHISPQLSQAYAVSNNVPYMPVTNSVPNHLSNGPYVTYPVPIQQQQSGPLAYNQHSLGYEHSLNQEPVFNNNFIAKYNTPTIYGASNKIMPQNPFLTMYNSLESVPYIDDYSLSNPGYQNPMKVSKFEMYPKTFVQPQLAYNHVTNTITKSSNAINKNVPQIYTTGPHITEYGRSKASQYGNYISELAPTKVLHNYGKNKNSYTTKTSQRYKSVRPQDSATFENLMNLIKERLSQCCNECKDNILKSLDESLKHKQYGGNKEKLKVLEINVKPYATIMDKTHPITYRKSSREEDFEHKQWLMEMSEKGYDKNYLNKQHQRDYLKDGKLNLHIDDDTGDYEPEEETVFTKNNQSYKRETTVPEAVVELEPETEIVTDAIEIENNNEKIQVEERNENEEEEEEDDHEEVEIEEEPEIVNEKLETHESKQQKLHKKLVKESAKKPIVAEKDNPIKMLKLDDLNLNITKSLETAESTTHSVYALRGQFRTPKRHPVPFALRQGKQFANYKNINKLGKTNVITKSLKTETNALDKDDKLEEILDILHDLSKQNKDKEKVTTKEDKTKEQFSTKIHSTTVKPLNKQNILHKIQNIKESTSTASQNSTENLNSNSSTTKHKTPKLSRRRKISSKSRKLIKKSTASVEDKVDTNK